MCLLGFGNEKTPVVWEFFYVNSNLNKRVLKEIKSKTVKTVYFFNWFSIEFLEVAKRKSKVNEIINTWVKLIDR